MPLTLSVLDQSVAVAGRGEDAALRDTLALAEHVEALGYRRFWLSEHHGLSSIVGTVSLNISRSLCLKASNSVLICF